MLPLKNNPILLPHQTEILKLFFDSSLSKTFFLTGGTALSAFYLAHRISQDLDLFTLKPFDSLILLDTIRMIAEKTEAKILTKVKTLKYLEIYLENKKKKWTQRLDFVEDQPVHFGKIKALDRIKVDSLINIATNKILSIYGRLDMKDYIDLYFILHEGYDFFALFNLAKKKDTGLHEFYFANIIAKIEEYNIFPQILKPFPKDELKKFYLSLSRDLLLRIKPK